MEKLKIAVMAEDLLLRGPVKRLVLRQGSEVIEAATIGDLIASLSQSKPDVVIIVSSQEAPNGGLEAARKFRRHDCKTPIILIASYSSEKLAIEALRIGVTDYLRMPVLPEDLQASINRSVSATRLESGAKCELSALELFNDEQMIGRSLPIMGITTSLKEIAATDCTVLITGETGTGKELVARQIHRHSRRCRKPFMVINCAAIPDTLLESELFGHERGAFTGAHTRREGVIQACNSGTLFFDEIGDMSPFAQAKILRTMENKEVTPVGGRSTGTLDVRFIAATNQDLENLMREGKFRPDLYFRINVFRIQLPPLRERKGDIVLLLEYFRKRLNRQLGKKVEGFSDEVVASFIDYEWPGNVRELRNLLEATFITSHRSVVFSDLPEFFRTRLVELQASNGLSQDERSRLLAALFETKWNKTKAAQQLQWSRMTLYRKMEKYRISAPSKEDPSTDRRKFWETVTH